MPISACAKCGEPWGYFVKGKYLCKGHYQEFMESSKVKPKPLHIQSFLRTGNKPELAADVHGIDTTRGKRYPNLISFRYNMLKAKMDEPIVQQCRGLILDEDDNWNVVARPFDKFFNAHEGHAAKIDWSTAIVYEKLDGSMCYIYFYDNGWHVATLGSPDASGDVMGTSMTFKDLFWQVFTDKGYKLPPNAAKGFTYMFELCTPMNKVVVQHSTRDLWLIGMREKSYGHEYTITNNKVYEPAPRFKLSTMDEIEQSFDDIDPIVQEGYVVCDANFNRIKVKHPGYVALHHMKEHFSVRYMVELVRKAEIDEVIAYFPEWAKFLLAIKYEYDMLIADIAEAYNEHRKIEKQKDFALAVDGYSFKSILFALRADKVAGIPEALRDIHIDRLIRMIDMPNLEVEDAIKAQQLIGAA